MNAWAVPGYTEERELGRGASSRVVAAIHIGSGQQVAIKYLAPRLFRDPNFLARFREEVQVLRALDVPEVVRLFDYVEEPGQGAAIVMELVDGVSLHEMITRQGPTTPESALVVLMGSLLGLASAHQLGIVHRDYKPENVLVDDAGNSKLTDFGIAVRAGEKAPATGTPLYMAPEQWTGEPATQATDIYAATAVFFECLTGKAPFSGGLGQLATQHRTAPVPVAMVDQPLRAFIERGMAKDPRQRPAHAVEFVAELISAADVAYGPDWEERGHRELAKRAAALLLLLLGGVGGAAGGSFAASLFGGMARRKRAVFAGAAVGVVAVVAVTTTTLALQSNDTNAGTRLASTSTPTAGAPAPNSPTSTAAAGGPTTGTPTTKSPTASPSASGTATASPTTNPTASSAPTTSAPTTSAPDHQCPDHQCPDHASAHHQCPDHPAARAGHHGGGQLGYRLGHLPGHAVAHCAWHDQLQPGGHRDLPLGPLRPDKHRAGHGEDPGRRYGQRPGLGDGSVEPVGDRRHAGGDVPVRPQRRHQGGRPVLLSNAHAGQSGHAVPHGRAVVHPVTQAVRRQ